MPSCSIMFRWSSAAVQVVVSTGGWAKRTAARRAAERSAVRFMNDKRTYLVRERNKWANWQFHLLLQASRGCQLRPHRVSPARPHRHRLLPQTQATRRLAVRPAVPSPKSGGAAVWSKRLTVELVHRHSHTAPRHWV